MKPALGWTLLSRMALRKAETQLYDDLQGVRDEIGFLTPHQLYADYFFPGTSVLHTRLRYVLFIPWIYMSLAEERGAGNPAARLQRKELWLTGRLKEAREEGVIGGRVYPKPAVQSPSMAYWSALGAWRILRPYPDGSLPSRGGLQRQHAGATMPAQPLDDDHEPLQTGHAPFVGMPSRPADWGKDTARLDFKLRQCEATFLRRHWRALKRSDGEPALLAQIALQNADLSEATDAWSTALCAVADKPDKARLERAQRLSALVAIGRAVYAAQVETLREKEDRQATPDEWRSGWRETVREHWPAAQKLDLKTVREDFPFSRSLGAVLPLLEATQIWVAARKREPLELLEPFTQAELGRKGTRARLPRNRSGRERRLAWQASDTPAAPLHYRWASVRRLVFDLQAAL